MHLKPCVLTRKKAFKYFNSAACAWYKLQAKCSAPLDAHLPEVKLIDIQHELKQRLHPAGVDVLILWTVQTRHYKFG